MADEQGEVVIRDPAGTEHVFPPGFDPQKAASIVRAAMEHEPDTYWGGFLKSAADTAKKTATGVVEGLNPIAAVQGVVRSAMHPVDTAAGVANAVMHPVDTAQSLSDPETGGRAIGSLLLGGAAGRVLPAAGRAAVSVPVRTATAGALDTAAAVADNPIVGVFSPRAAQAGKLAGKLADAVRPDPVAVAQAEVAAGRLSPAVLRGVERAAAQRAAASGVPAAAPAAPVETAPTVAAQPPAAAPVVQPAPPVPAAAAPPVGAAAPAVAFSPQRALNELALSARRAKTALTGTEMQAALDAVRQGATVPDALASVLKDRLAAPAATVEAAPVDPAAAFAQHFNLPADPVTTFPKGMRGASTSAGIRDPKTGQFVSSARLDELLKTKFGGTGQ